MTSTEGSRWIVRGDGKDRKSFIVACLDSEDQANAWISKNTNGLDLAVLEMEQSELDRLPTMAQIYAGETNIRIESDWDGGYDWYLGGTPYNNPDRKPTGWSSTFEDAVLGIRLLHSGLALTNGNEKE